MRLQTQVAPEIQKRLLLSRVEAESLKERDILCPLYQSIKVVGIHCIFVFDSGHAKCFPEIIGNKRGISSGFWKLSFVERQYNEIPEVQITCFQYSHDLHSDSRFSVERNVRRCQYFGNQSFQSIGAYI